MSDGLRVDIESLSEIEGEFHARSRAMVWCNAATIDRAGRPRSRILHPIWEGHVGWVGTFPESFKTKHLAANPHISLAYISDISKPMYVDCVATWETDELQKELVWNYFKAMPEPLGYDPAPIFGGATDERFALLKLIPWRVQLDDIPPGTRQIWIDPDYR